MSKETAKIKINQLRLPMGNNVPYQPRMTESGRDFMFTLSLTNPLRNRLIHEHITSLDELIEVARKEYEVPGIDDADVQQIRAAIAEYTGRDNDKEMKMAANIAQSLWRQAPMVQPDKDLLPKRRTRKTIDN